MGARFKVTDKDLMFKFSYIKTVAFAVLIMLLMLAVSEICLYAKGYRLISSQDRFRTYIPRPKERNLEKTEEEKQKLSLSNSPCKVLVLGCSYTFGVLLKEPETFVWQLNERFPNAIFDNCAIPGSGTYQCLQVMQQKLDEKDYDIVLYVSINEHLERNMSVEAQKITGGFIEVTRPCAFYENEGFVFRNLSGEFWPGENHLLTVNFLKKIYIAKKIRNYNRYCRQTAKKDRLALQLKLYLDLLNRMNKLASDNYCIFALVSLEDEAGLIPKNVPFPHLNLANSKYYSSQFRFDDPGRHPKANLNKIWAKDIENWLIKEPTIKPYFLNHP